MMKEYVGKINCLIMPSTLAYVCDCTVTCMDSMSNIIMSIQDFVKADKPLSFYLLGSELRHIMREHSITLKEIEQKFIEGMNKYNFLNFNEPLEPKEHNIYKFSPLKTMVCLLADSAIRHYLQMHHMLASNEDISMHKAGVVTNILMLMNIVKRDRL